MSVRAYRIIKKELAEDCSFNLWHDTELMDFFEDNDEGGDFRMRTDEGGGEVEISVSLLKKALADYKWGGEDDYHIKAIEADIAWAEEQKKDWIIYECY